MKYNFLGYVILGDSGIKFIYVDGCFIKFEIMSDFKEIIIGDFLIFKFKVDVWFVVCIDVMLSWFIIVEGLSLWVIMNIDDEELNFVGNFDIKEKWKCFIKDVYNLYMLK